MLYLITYIFYKKDWLNEIICIIVSVEINDNKVKLSYNLF